MKGIFTFVLFLGFTSLFGQVHKAQRVELLGHWSADTFPKNSFGASFSSCWGYEKDGREYAIVGCTNGTMFVEVTDPSNPTPVDFIPGLRQDAIWREYKTYQNFLYMGSDDFGEEFKIVDLSYLPDSVHLVYAGRDFITNAHTLFIEGDYLYIGLHDGGSMSVFDLKEDPLQPKLLRKLFEDGISGGVHDMYVRNDTVYASMGWEQNLQILKFSGEHFESIGSLSQYIFAGYNHSSYLTPDGKTLIMLDEVPNSLPGKSVDVTDPANPIVIDTFHTYTGTATLHNPFPGPNSKFVVAAYEDGVQIYDYSNPSDITLTGYFDTHHQSDPGTGGYNGAWSAYTELPSGNMIVVDMENGLYMLDATEAYNYKPSSDVRKPEILSNIFSISPQPASDELFLHFESNWTGETRLKITDINGREVFNQVLNLNNDKTSKISLPALTAGNYVLIIENNGRVATEKLMIK